MLQMVAMPVQEMELTPSPKYSMMAPVPPFTVRMSANCVDDTKQTAISTSKHREKDGEPQHSNDVPSK
jgi:hypothetical protein